MEKFKFDNGEHEFTGIESESGKSLIFSDEFKEIVQKHPGLIGKIYKAVRNGFYDPKHLLRDEDEFHFDFDGSGRLNTSRLCIKVDIAHSDEEYFVKADRIGENSYREILVMEYVKEVLKDLPWVKFADYQCGYFDKNGFGYYVAKWNDLISKNISGLKLKMSNIKEWENFEEKKKIILEILSPLGIDDLVDRNLSYDIDTGDLYLYDLRMKDGDFNALMDRRREDFKLQK